MVTRRPRGFTLVELLVAGTVALVVIAAAMTLLSRLLVVHRRELERTRMRGAAQLVISRLGTELRQAGLGVPDGPRASTEEPFPARVHLAQPQAVGFWADLPRPDGVLNGFSYLASDQDLTFTGAALTNELNGGCDVLTASSAPCNTDTASLLLPPSGTGCGASPTAPSCPWSLGKYRPGEHVVIANAYGIWDEFRVPAGTVAYAAGGRRGLALDAQPLFVGGPNRSFVSTPDRVFYRLRGRTLERAQCWGPLGSRAELAGAITCAEAREGTTGWEPLATSVAAFALSYASAEGSSAAGNQIRRVHAVLELASNAGEAPQRVRVETTVAIR